MKERWSSVSDKFLSFFFFFGLMACHLAALISWVYAAHLQWVMALFMGDLVHICWPREDKGPADQDEGLECAAH